MMPAFQPPEMTSTMDKDWRTRAKPGFRDPKFLWEELYPKYNTMSMPILTPNEFFASALDAANKARDRQHLEELVAQQHEERCRFLENSMAYIVRSSLSLQTPFPSAAIRKTALEVGQTGGLVSLARFVCDVISGWRDREKEGNPSQICAADEFDGGGGDDNNAQYNMSEDGGDPYELENSFPDELNPLPEWDHREDDRWNGVSQMGARVTECEAGDAPSERSGRLSLTTSADDTKSIMRGEISEAQTTSTSTDRPLELSSAPPESPVHISSPKTHSQSPRSADGVPADTGLPSSTNSLSAIGPQLPQAMSPQGFKPSADLPNANPVNEANSFPNPTSPEGESRGQPDGQAQSDCSATSRVLSKKRHFQESDDEDGDERPKRQKRSYW